MQNIAVLYVYFALQEQKKQDKFNSKIWTIIERFVVSRLKTYDPEFSAVLCNTRKIILTEYSSAVFLYFTTVKLMVAIFLLDIIHVSCVKLAPPHYLMLKNEDENK